MVQTRKKLILGSLLCLLASMAWGGMFPVASSAMQHIDAFYLTVIRYGVITVLLVILLLMTEGKKAFKLEGQGKWLLLYGTMAFTVYNILIFWGQHRMGESGVIAASLMEAMMPLISIGLLWALHKKTLPRYAMISMVVALVGGLFVITKGDWGFFLNVNQHMVPMLSLLIAVFGWVVYTIGGGKFSHWSILRYSTLTCLFGTVVTCMFVGGASAAGLVSVPIVAEMWTVKYEMLYMIVAAGIIALLSWNAGIKYVGAVNGILFINFVPITTLFIMALQGYAISLYEYYGTALVVIALLYNNICQRIALTQRTGQRVKLGLPLLHKYKVRA